MVITSLPRFLVNVGSEVLDDLVHFPEILDLTFTTFLGRDAKWTS